MRGRTITVALCAVLFVSVAPGGLADSTSLRDENDAYGPLDIKRISFDHGIDEGDLVHRLTTYGKWRRKTLRSEDSEILFLFSTDKDNKPERVLVIDSNKQRIVGEMRSWNNGPGKKVYGRAPLTRKNNRSLEVLFQRSLLGKKVREYGWHVDTRFHDGNHSRCNFDNGTVVVCPDSAPNDNDPRSYLRHRSKK